MGKNIPRESSENLDVRRWAFGWFGILLSAAFISTVLCAAEPNYRVAVVWDDDSWYFDGLVDRWEAELQSLAGDYAFEVERERWNAKGKFDEIPDLLRQALSDPEVDLIYAAGVYATEAARSLPILYRTKPIVGGAVQMVDSALLSDWLKTPGGGETSARTVSAIPNFTFIANSQRVMDDLKLLLRLEPTDLVHVLLDRELISRLEQLEKGVGFFEEKLGVKFEILGAAKTAEETLSAIPEGVRAMYVALQSRMEAKEREALYRGLAEKGIVTVAMAGRRDVELGALGGLAPDSQGMIGRRTALNIYQLLLGVGTDTLTVPLPIQDRRVVNLEAARLANWAPDYELSIETEFLNSDEFLIRRKISLEEAMELARQANAKVLIAREEPEIRRQSARNTLGNLLPNLDLNSRAGATDYSDIINPMLTPEFARQLSVGVQLRQLLYSDAVVSAYRAQKRATSAAEFELESRKLDAIMSAASAYFDVLSARALREIERENLERTLNNLSLAQLRVAIGAAEPAEVLRWNRDRARNRAALIERDYRLKNAMVALNQIIAEPRDQPLELEDVRLRSDDDFYFFGEQLKPIVVNLTRFNRMGKFLQLYAVAASPELAGFDYGLVGQGILLRQKKRRYYVPDLALSMRADRVTSRTSFFPTSGQNEYTVGIELAFPLFAGGSRKAEIEERKATIRQLNQQREQAVQQLEVGALVAKNNMGFSHPNILLNKLALREAEALYDSVLQKYSLGAANYLTLLDAQQAVFVQRQQRVLAEYQYLVEVHRMQRAIAWFEYDKTPAERQAWKELLTEFLEHERFSQPARALLGAGREVRGAAAAVIESAQSR